MRSFIFTDDLCQRCVQFSAHPSLALLGTSPGFRRAAERTAPGLTVSSNHFHVSPQEPPLDGEESLLCVVRNVTGLALSCWWLRRRTTPAPHNPVVRTSSMTCSLSLHYGDLAAPAPLPSSLSLGELMSIGIVGSLTLCRVHLPPTPMEYVPYLQYAHQLRRLRVSGEAKVPVRDLGTLLHTHAGTLAVVEMDDLSLPELLPLLTLAASVERLRVRNVRPHHETAIPPRPEGEDHLVSRTPHEVVTTSSPLDAAPFSLNALGHLQSLQTLEWRGSPLLSLSGLTRCKNLTVLHLVHCAVREEHLPELAALAQVEQLVLTGAFITTVRPLQHCRRLVHLNLARTRVTSSGICGLERLPQLRTLILTRTMVESVTALSACPQLETLDLSYTGVRNDGLRGLGQIPTLWWLSLSNCVEVDALSFLETHHPEASVLRFLNLRSSGISSEGLRWLRHAPCLEELILTDCVEVAEVEVLAACPALVRLSLANTKVKDIRCLEGLGRLEILNLSDTRVRCVHALRHCRALRELLIQHCPLAPEAAGTTTGIGSVSSLGTLPRLDSLSLAQCNIHSLEGLAAAPALRVLNLWRTRLTTRGVALLGLASPQLTELDLGVTRLCSVTPLVGCGKLEKLILSGCRRLKTIVGLERLHALRELDLSRTAVRDVRVLSTSRVLQVLNLSHTPVRKEGLHGLERLRALRVLLLTETAVESVGVWGTSSLRDLHVRGCPITSEGLVGLERAAYLRKLNLSFTKITCGVARLAQCRSLEKLDVRFLMLPREELLSLQRQLPRCRISSDAL